MQNINECPESMQSLSNAAKFPFKPPKTFEVGVPHELVLLSGLLAQLGHLYTSRWDTWSTTARPLRCSCWFHSALRECLCKNNYFQFGWLEWLSFFSRYANNQKPIDQEATRLVVSGWVISFSSSPCKIMFLLFVITASGLLGGNRNSRALERPSMSRSWMRRAAAAAGCKWCWCWSCCLTAPPLFWHRKNRSEALYSIKCHVSHFWTQRDNIAELFGLLLPPAVSTSPDLQKHFELVDARVQPLRYGGAQRWIIMQTRQSHKQNSSVVAAWRWKLLTVMGNRRTGPWPDSELLSPDSTELTETWHSRLKKSLLLLVHSSRETNMYNFITNMHMQKKERIKVGTKVA